MPDGDFNELTAPPTKSPNVQATKKYVFNETGNIMLSSTALEGQTIPDEVRAVFSEVSVFFAAMTKAISESIDPKTGKNYSLYDYDAMQNVIDGSGLFVHVTEEDITHKSSSFGADFSKELIEGILGLAAGAGALSFAQGMIASMGKAGLNVGGSHSSSSSKVANIVFICEYLLGMPIISAMVISVDKEANKQAFHIGPCIKEQSVKITLTMHKDTYLFVTPKFIREYSADLDSVTTDVQYLEFVDYLQALVQGTPVITGIEDLVGATAPSALKKNKTYAITGSFLDNGGKRIKGRKGQISPTVKVAWIGPNNAMGAEVANAEVQPNMISFSVSSGPADAAAIGLFFSQDDGKTFSLAVASQGTYTVNPDH